jgi:hypothetical protein
MGLSWWHNGDPFALRCIKEAFDQIPSQTLSESIEPLAELSNSVTPAYAVVQKLSENLDSGLRRNDAQRLLQKALLL